MSLVNRLGQAYSLLLQQAELMGIGGVKHDMSPALPVTRHPGISPRVSLVDAG